MNVWSEDKPQVPGFYWKYGLLYGGMEIVHVSKAEDQWWVNGEKMEDDYLWAGPIPFPIGEVPKPKLIA